MATKTEKSELIEVVWISTTGGSPLAVPLSDWPQIVEQLQTLLDQDGTWATVKRETMSRKDFESLPEHEGW